MKKTQLNSIVMSRVLIATLIIIALAIGGGIYFALGVLQAQALRTDHAKIDAELSQDEINRLKTLSSDLEKNKAIVDKAAEVVAQSKEYAYQDQAINDMKAYAARHNIMLSGFDFPTTAGSSGPASTTTPTGLKSVKITVAIGGSPKYTDMIAFMKDIENNLTKIQISSVTLNPDTENPSILMTPSLDIEVYLR